MLLLGDIPVGTANQHLSMRIRIQEDLLNADPCGRIRNTAANAANVEAGFVYGCAAGVVHGAVAVVTDNANAAFDIHMCRCFKC